MDIGYYNIDIECHNFFKEREYFRYTKFLNEKTDLQALNAHWKIATTWINRTDGALHIEFSASSIVPKEFHLHMKVRKAQSFISAHHPLDQMTGGLTGRPLQELGQM